MAKEISLKSYTLVQKVANSPNMIAYIPNYMNCIAISTTDRFDNGTMRIIYGNEIAANYAWSGKGINYPNDAILYPVTWDQKQDSVWFRALISAEIKSIEILKFHKDRDEGKSISAVLLMV